MCWIAEILYHLFHRPLKGKILPSETTSGGSTFGDLIGNKNVFIVEDHVA